MRVLNLLATVACGVAMIMCIQHGAYGMAVFQGALSLCNFYFWDVQV